MGGLKSWQAASKYPLYRSLLHRAVLCCAVLCTVCTNQYAVFHHWLTTAAVSVALAREMTPQEKFKYIPLGATAREFRIRAGSVVRACEIALESTA